jgi:ABC-type cobalamin/Fe3+-siderophores transport system ATPase subunit
MFSKNWHTSSGGERKKALIAKAISETKKILFLDEPFNHLDTKSSNLVSEEIIELSKSGVSVLYIGHDFIIPGSKDYRVDQWMF